MSERSQTASRQAVQKDMDALATKSFWAQSPHVAFETFHPALAAVYLAGVLALSMFAIHPVITSLALISALACSLVCRGVLQTLGDMRWQLPLGALVALANPLFSASGSTLLVKLGPLAIYQEALLFGVCMAAMLVATLIWLAVAGVMLPHDRLLVLFGAVLPTIGLMVSMAFRLVPQLVRRGHEFLAVQAANAPAAHAPAANAPATHAPAANAPAANAPATCASADVKEAPLQATAAASPHKTKERREPLSQRVVRAARMTGVLMAWSMADSLEASDAMRARGWSASKHRTSYQLYRFGMRDLLAFTLVCLLLLIAALLAALACLQYRFYPIASQLIVWWGYIPCALYFLLGAILSLKERLAWM